MALPVRTLPIVEHWDCHSCARCCRGSVIPLTDDDLVKIEAQKWHEHPDFRGTKVLVRRHFGSRKRILAKRRDGACVFLMDDGRCRIHLEHGIEAKPAVCQIFPLQLVPRAAGAYLTLRRSCPSAAASRGRKLETERADVRHAIRLQKQSLQTPEAPPVRGKIRLAWKDLDRVLRSFRKLMTDGHYPLVRRLAHALLLCDSLEMCDLRVLDARKQSELLQMLEESVLEEASPFFRDREPPSRAEAGLVRQSVFQFLRLHPRVEVEEGWRDRITLTGAGLRFLWGRGGVPKLVDGMGEAEFESVEQPLGPLEARVAEPLNLFIEAAATSGRFAILLPRGWSVIDGFRNLALSYVAAMWLTRLFSHDSKPSRDAMVDVVVALDRGHGFQPLTAPLHRRRIRGLSRPGRMTRLVAWYAR